MMEWPDRTPADVLDHHTLGYTYDIEVPQAPLSAGDPKGYLGEVPRVVFLAYDNHIHEIAIYPENGSWGHFDMTIGIAF